uniref:ATP synthase F1, epsilon subunit n=1 Tax=mine drainage metagenome TaxID=410659 RepID=E6QHR9_9ZZZZ
MATETNQLRVRFVTPDRVLVDEMATAVELPSKTGYIEVLYGHAPLLAELGAGDVTLHGAAGGHARYNVSWGFVEVLPERVTILANDALLPAAIDVPRAQQQLERGQSLWNAAGDSEEAYTEANRVIDEAQAKLASAAHRE